MLLSTRATHTVTAGSASIVNLMKEVQMSLFVSKLKVVGTSLLMCGLLTAGIASMAQQPPPPSAPARSAQDEVLDLERAWGDVLVHNDAALMDRIVAYEMVGTDPAGHRWNKSEYLESVKSGAFKIESFELADMKVRVFGDAAVATGRSIVNKNSKSGLPPGAVGLHRHVRTPQRLRAMRRMAISRSTRSGANSATDLSGSAAPATRWVPGAPAPSAPKNTTASPAEPKPGAE